MVNVFYYWKKTSVDFSQMKVAFLKSFSYKQSIHTKTIESQEIAFYIIFRCVPEIILFISLRKKNKPIVIYIFNRLTLDH